MNRTRICILFQAISIAYVVSPARAVETISTIFGAPGFDSASGDGFKTAQNQVYLVGTLLARDGTVLTRLDSLDGNVIQGTTHSLWRGTGSPTIFPVEPVGTYSYAHAINNSHVAIGDHAHGASRWSPAGEITSLGFGDDAIDINDAGQVLPGTNPAVRWDADGQVIDLQLPPGLDSSYAFSINNAGQIAGGAYQTEEPITPVRWEADGSATILGTTFTSGLELNTFEPNVINRHGAIAGVGAKVTQIVNGETRENEIGIYWNEAGQPIQLEQLPAVVRGRTRVLDMNEHGQIIGFQEVENSQRGVRWEPDGSVIELERFPLGSDGRSAYPLEINKFGYVVGSASQGSLFGPSVIWGPDGEITVLHYLRPPGSEWSLDGPAYAITDTGWVTGIGKFDPVGSAPAYSRAWSVLIPEAGTYGLGDANFDETINFADLLLVAQNYGQHTNGSVDMGDFDLDGVVGFSDLLTVAQNYEGDLAVLPNGASGNFTSDWQMARSMIPEPGVLGVIAFAGLALRRRPCL